MERLDTLSRWLYYSTGALNNQDMVLLYPEFFAVYAIEIFALEDKKYSILKDIYYEN